MVIIQLKDMCNFDENFEYEPFLVEEDEKFEEKYKELIKVCSEYQDFQEIPDFINNNFKVIPYEKRIIEI